MISLNQIQKIFHTRSGMTRALHDVNLEIQTGDIFGVIGKSGAGKSTLIRCVNLLERPTLGRVIVAGEELTALNISALRKARRKIGMIFQHFNLLSSRTIYQNIALPLELIGTSKKMIAKTLTPLLELTGLADKKDNYPEQLSGGQKQRVAIARALASQPKVLLSDEATSALDPETTLTILNLLKDVRDAFCITILLITHEMSVIKACCDHVAILHHGELIEQNEVGEFFAHPKTKIAKNFIVSAMPHNLPNALQKSLQPQESENTHPVWRLWFHSKTATQPIISQLINLFGLRINILQANVEYIKNHAMGIMIIALEGAREKISQAREYLEKLGLVVEIMGHVSSDVVTFV